MSANAYMGAWLIYLGGALLMVLLAWWLTRRWPPLINTPLLLMLLALLVMPWTVAPDVASQAPAWVVSLFDGLIRDEESFRRAGMPLLLVVCAAAVLGVVLGLARHRWRKRRSG